MTLARDNLRARDPCEAGCAFKGELFSDSGDNIVLTPGNFNEGGGFRIDPRRIGLTSVTSLNPSFSRRRSVLNDGTGAVIVG